MLDGFDAKESIEDTATKWKSCCIRYDAPDAEAASDVIPERFDADDREPPPPRKRGPIAPLPAPPPSPAGGRGVKPARTPPQRRPPKERGETNAPVRPARARFGA